MDREFEPDEPTIEVGCPDWCRNACISACPTGALTGPRRIDPRRCISYLTYFGQGLTPAEFREPMGLWVYGCDRCQNVCPRNAPWLARELKMNEEAAGMVGDFRLERLLHMDKAWFMEKIWPHRCPRRETGTRNLPSGERRYRSAGDSYGAGGGRSLPPLP